jgi:aldose 1-epimerase
VNTLSKLYRPSLVTLAAGDLTVELAPEIGGSVASFRARRSGATVNLMRPMPEEAQARRDPAHAAMFPMVPYANRIAGNCFDFEGNTYRFKQNIAGEPFTIHGTAWQAAWTVRRANEVSAELTLTHLEPGQPYSYSAFQRFHLFTDRLTVTTGVTNCGVRAMPFGLGQHPFWDRTADVTLRFRSTHFWLRAPDSVPAERLATPTDVDFSQARPLPQTRLDNCYSGWDGHAEIRFPRSGIGVRIEASTLYRHLMLYCDPEKTAFCLEPQTHAAGALNRMVNNDEDDLGLFVLKPGESAEANVSFIQFLT